MFPGWGHLSQPTELHVLYPPKNSKISYEPSLVKKGQTLEVSINIEYPSQVTFITRDRVVRESITQICDGIVVWH
jgi:hypothetical protein